MQKNSVLKKKKKTVKRLRSTTLFRCCLHKCPNEWI